MTKKGATGRNRDATCSFCRKSYRDVGPLVEGPGDVYICGECVELCQSIIEQEKRRRSPPEEYVPAIPPPADVEETLHPFFAGQAEAVRAVCTAVRGHYEHLARDRRHHDPPEADGSGILLLGPSRSSKLFLARFLAHLFGVPFAHGDAGTPLQADASGEEGGSILYKLLVASDFDIVAAQRGIVYLEGVDQPCVQDRLLAMLQGRAADLLPPGFQPDLTNLLLVGGGLFLGLDAVRREPGNPVTTDDLITYGMIPRLAQRFTVIVTLAALDEDALARFIASADLKGLSDRNG